MIVLPLLRGVKRCALTPLDWILLRFVLPRDTLVVVGDRRSGNHACIYWILSCIAGRDILRAYGKHGSQGIRHFSVEGITFVNDITNIKSRLGIRGLIVRNRDLLRKSPVVVLSFEDVSPESIRTHPLLGKLRTIRVKRNIPDLLASRYESMVQLALQGGGSQQLFSMDGRWFRNLRYWYRMRSMDTNGYALHFWDYDQWRISSVYRKEFLRLIHLDRDIFPIQHAAEGGGSSFRSSPDTKDRLLAVTFQAPFRQFLKRAIKLVPECFSLDDMARVDRYLSK